MANDPLVEALEDLARRREEMRDTRSALADETAQAVRRAHTAGMSPTEISRRLRISRQAVYGSLDAQPNC